MKMKLTFALIALFCSSAFAQHKQPDASSPSGVEFREIGPKMRNMGLFDDMNEGDTLIEVNDRRVKRIKELEEIFKDIRPGTEVRLKYNHNGKVEERKKRSK